MNIEVVCQSQTLNQPVTPLTVLVQFNAVSGNGYYTFVMAPEQAVGYAIGTHYKITLGPLA